MPLALTIYTIAMPNVPSPSTHPVRPLSREAARQLKRLRAVCEGMPECTEKLSHGTPCFFADAKAKSGVFASFDNNHHDAGHIAVWIPAAPGMQEALVEEAPEIYFRPPYVGAKGWVGIELARVSDEALEIHIREAWNMVAAKKKPAKRLL